jgi:type IX secretion system PorP/SprF family membrane protein
LRQIYLTLFKWCFIILLVIPSLSGQDLHYSQFYNSPLNINPALTGIFNGDLRFSGNFRDQWRSVPVPYTTYTGTFDMKLYPSNSEKGFWGFGVNFNYDESGFVKLNLVQIGLSLSYTAILNQNNFLTGGLSIGVAQRSLGERNITSPNQWTGLQFDPTLPIGENFDNFNFLYFDFSGGLNYRLQGNDTRSKLDLGAGYFHINRPNQTFLEGGARNGLPSRLSLHALGALKLTNSLDLLVNAMYQTQGPNSETLAGLGAKIHINQRRGRELAFALLAHSRFGDAIIPSIEFHYKTWHAGFSYDFNTSAFTQATNRRGGPELSLSCRILKVKPLPRYKTCPIY